MQAVDKSTQARTARVFLSYKRHVEPDQSLAQQMVSGLSEAGHAVFIDQRLTIGQAWAREIEAQVRQSDYLIVFLTADSSRSEMVRGEIEIARHHAAVNARPRILPVRVAFDGPLPYPLNAYLDSIQYASWTKPDDTPRLLNELLAAIGGKVSPEFRTAPATAADASSQPPSYAAPLPVPGGTLDVDDPWYLPRPTDAMALSAIRQPGQTLTIKGPRQMGKSSLLMRTVKAALDSARRWRCSISSWSTKSRRRTPTCSSAGSPRRSRNSSSCPTPSTSRGTRATRTRRTAPATSSARSCSRSTRRA